MKVAPSLITVLIVLAARAAGHTSRGHITTYVRRSCKSRPTTGVVSSTLPPAMPNSDTLPTSSSTPVTSQPMPSSSNWSAANAGPVGGLVTVVSAGSCGSSGATTQTTALSGPNGHINFLNCGLTSGGWTPPLLYITGIVTVELSQIAYNSGSAFSACKDFIPLFEKYGRQYGVPAIMLASFAMQESSCVPTTVGGAGEQGLMQITVDKCGGAPDGNCQDPDFNIHQGAQFFSQTLESVNGDLLLAIGRYNGWHKGLTYAEATAAARNGNCHEQNNLDYLHQFLNGWMQDINIYENSPPLGKYFNLNTCSN